MTIANGGFETAGVNEYDALSWTVTVVATNATVFVAWDTGISNFALAGAETFVGWGSFVTGFNGFYIDLTPGTFDLLGAPTEVEDFENLWGSGPAKTVVADNGSSNGPYALTNGMTLQVSVNGVVQTITFSASNFNNIASARAEEVANAINLTLTAAEAVLVGGAVRLQTTAFGLSQSIQVTGGTAFTFLPFTTTTYYGTGVGDGFIKTMEFSTAQFGATLANVEDFETAWPTGVGDLVTDAGDTVRTMIIHAADTFETGWGTYNLSLGGGVTYTDAAFTGTGTNETFEGTWALATTF